MDKPKKQTREVRKQVRSKTQHIDSVVNAPNDAGSEAEL